MNFPSQEEFIKLNEQSKNYLIDLYMVKVEGDEEVIDKNLKSW